MSRMRKFLLTNFNQKKANYVAEIRGNFQTLYATASGKPAQPLLGMAAKTVVFPGNIEF